MITVIFSKNFVTDASKYVRNISNYFLILQCFLYKFNSKKGSIFRYINGGFHGQMTGSYYKFLPIM